MQSIYLDNAATTRVDSDIANAALTVMTEDYANPSSLYAMGLGAERMIKSAERRILEALGARQGRVVFTSGGTESDNLAIIGGATARYGRGRHVVTSAVEHSAVLGAAGELERRGFEVTYLPPGGMGAIEPDALARACREDTVLVSLMAVNNETGAQSDIPSILSAVRGRSPNALFHCDAVQAFGKIAFAAREWGADLISISGHKLHAPKGVGALYIGDKVRIEPIVFGGGQQDNLRPGTENVPSIHAFGLAAQKAMEGRLALYERAVSLRDQLADGVAGMGEVCINSPLGGSPYIFNFSMPGYRSEVVLHFLEARGIYLSAGSACGRGRASHVLKAMGFSPRVIDSALRVSFSHSNTSDDVAALIAALRDAKKQLIKSR